MRALGSTSDRPPKAGEKTYVDAIIEQSSAYAHANGLKYTNDLDGLRKDLLSHGDGQGKHASIHFIDTNTRDSINAWASSGEGKQWIHQNVDYPQTKSITESAVSLVDAYGKNIPADHRFETFCILAKTENQIPGKMAGFEKVLRDGGNYDDVLQHAYKLHAAVKFYDGLKAAAVAEAYEKEYGAPGKKEALDRAQMKVGSSTYDPSTEKNDPDIKEALRAIGETAPTHSHRASGSLLEQGVHSQAVSTLQIELGALGYTDSKGQPLKPDKRFGPDTRAAVEAFQRDHHLTIDGVAGPKTLAVIHQQTQAAKTSGLDSPSNPDHALYAQAKKAVHDLDKRQGRISDQHSNNLAAALTFAARHDGLNRIDQVALSEDGSRAFAVQNGVFKQFAQVQTAEAVNTPMAQSTQALLTLPKQTNPAQAQISTPQQAQPNRP